MSEFPWKPLRICLDLDRHISEAFQELIHRPRGTSSQSALSQPEIDVYDTDDSYIIDADVPGVSTDDLEVSVREHTGTISGSRGATGIGQTAQGLRIERRQAAFSGRFFLDDAVDTGSVEERFHVWPANDVCEAASLLTGLPAGDVSDAGSCNGRVAKWLQEMVEILTEQRIMAERMIWTHGMPVEFPEDPHPPFPGE